MSEPRTYVAYCIACDKIVAATVDSPDHRKDTARDVASFVRDGLRVEQLETEAVRKGAWCECWRKKQAEKRKPVFGQPETGRP